MIIIIDYQLGFEDFNFELMADREVNQKFLAGVFCLSKIPTAILLLSLSCSAYCND